MIMTDIGGVDMNVNDEINMLKQRIAELEKHRDFPQLGDTYWYIGIRGNIFISQWEDFPSERDMLSFGNIFQNEDQAKFAVEKLKVEAELRKFGRPFKEDEYNYFIQIRPSHNNVTLDSDECYQTQGTIYFESAEKARQAIEAVGGRDRIKKYIFGTED